MITLREAMGRSCACAALLCACAGTAAGSTAAFTGARAGVPLAAPADGAAQDDAAVLQCASEQGWRELIEALARVAPPRTDAERAAFDRARLRVDATDPRRSSQARAEAWLALDAAHAARIAGATDTLAQRRAVVERATDALRIGLFAEPSTASALASGQPHDVAKALALLRAIEDATRPGDARRDAGEIDRTLAFLHASSQALQLGIDRADRGGAASRERRTRAAAALERVRTAREGMPASLQAAADLAECAAASAAGDADAARAAAVRIVYLGEPLPAMLGRIFVCDALAASRMGDRALTELVQVIRVDGLSLPLRILAADAYVRLRDSLGKSSLAGPTFEAYGEVVRRSAPQERWASRLAVIERLGPIAVRAADADWMPTEGLVARAHAQRIAGLVAAGDSLRAELAETSPDRVAMAAAAAMDASVRTRDPSLAADALKVLATRFPDDPQWTGCASELAMLEIAHDSANPGTRPAELAASIVLALELADARTPAPMLAVAKQAVDALDAARSRSLASAEAAARLSRLLAGCGELDSGALADTRVLAAILVLDACAIDPAAGSAGAQPSAPAGLSDIHPSDAALLGACLAERARDAAGSAVAAAAAARLASLSHVASCANAARGARDVIAGWNASTAAPDAQTARGLAAVLDAAATIDPPELDSMRLDVRLARHWGGLSPPSAAERSAKARAAADHPGASDEDLLALADALIDEAALAEPTARAGMLGEAMAIARAAESLNAKDGDRPAAVATQIHWSARERMVRAARLAGRDAEAQAHVARLAAIDASFGGQPGRFADP